MHRFSPHIYLFLIGTFVYACERVNTFCIYCVMGLFLLVHNADFCIKGDISLCGMQKELQDQKLKSSAAMGYEVKTMWDKYLIYFIALPLIPETCMFEA